MTAATGMAVQSDASVRSRGHAGADDPEIEDRRRPLGKVRPISSESCRHSGDKKRAVHPDAPFYGHRNDRILDATDEVQRHGVAWRVVITGRRS